MSVEIEDGWVLISALAFQSVALLHVTPVAFGKLPWTLRREWVKEANNVLDLSSATYENWKTIDSYLLFLAKIEVFRNF